MSGSATAETADYIIVGGGSAGCVVASRLSENRANQVILLEAGGKGDGFWVDMPAGVIKLVGDPSTDWIDVTEPDPSIHDRRITWNHGKLLGGGGAINAMVYFRGQRSDYDSWERAGCPGWSFKDVLPYFMSNENWQGAGDFSSHARNGHLSVSHNFTRSLLVAKFIAAAENNGLPFLEDYCSGNTNGVFYILAHQLKGRRCSPAQAYLYLKSAPRRPNLKIWTHALVNHVLFEKGRALGVDVSRAGQSCQLRARREVILCAGATNSPIILMRSGVGPAEQLATHGIAVVADRKNVGRNLMDHATISQRCLVDLPSFNSQLQSRLKVAREFFRYITQGTGALTLALAQASAGVKTSADLSDPDVTAYFSSYVFDPTKPPLKPGRAPIFPLLDKPAASVSTLVNRPYSRGEIRLGGPSADDRPSIRPGLLSDERDLETLLRAAKVIEKIFATQPLAQHVRGSLLPALRTDDEWRDHIRRTVGVSWHASGTCRMGGDPDSVVDPELRVRGVRALRVIDTSIMPNLVSGNTNAPAMMIGERGAAFISGEPTHN